MPDNGASGKPCPVHVVVDGERRYCEQGHAGHWGTCVGDKSRAQYLAERRAASGSTAVPKPPR